MASTSAWLRGALTIGREMARLVLRRPVIGVLAVPLTDDGRVIMMRRRDTNSWCLPGGLMEWGEDLTTTIRRELAEETGWQLVEVQRLVGIYSDPRRDPRVHAVTILVEATAAAPPPAAPALNPLEVIAVDTFALSSLPTPLAFDTGRMIDDYLRGAPAVVA